MKENKDIILLSTADWDNPFWTNKQHVAVELARLGHRVLYIDSLGLRKPSASKRDISRIFRRIVKAVRPPRQVRDRLWVWSPIILPWHNVALIRVLNKLILGLGLHFWIAILRFKNNILWTYNPLTPELMNIQSFERCIYHCVDEIKSQPGMPVAVLECVEKELARQADMIFATAPKLAETRKEWNPNTYYLPNVADYEHFSSALDEQTQIPEDIRNIPSPRLGFIGAISGYKLNFNLIRETALSHPDWSMVLIGEVGEGDPWTDISLLQGLPNVFFLGPKPYQKLPAYLKAFDVALLPNNINEYTDSMFPMKFFEYLAAGVPVVSVDLKAIREFAHVVKIGRTSSEFIESIEEVLAGDVVALQDRLNLAREYTYQARTEKMLTMIELNGATP